MNNNQELKVLIEMRPALDGYAGIPQETRLLFHGLSKIKSIKIEGLIQASLRFVRPGVEDKVFIDIRKENNNFNLYNQVIKSIRNDTKSSNFEYILLFIKRKWTTYWLTFSTLILRFRKVKLTFFETDYFRDDIWSLFFDKTLLLSDFSLVTQQNFRVCSVPWNVLQSVGLNILKVKSVAIYPKFETKDIDIVITQTPYPARFERNTKIIVRYHDALPILIPDLFPNKVRHHATHYHALLSNIKSGAYFACVSESTRQDLIKLFPIVESRTVTIHNLISPHFFEEESSPTLVSKIVQARENLILTHEDSLNFENDDEKKKFYEKHLRYNPFKYLIMVSTIEPRKNHNLLLEALEIINSQIDPTIKLIVVGSLGWEYEAILKKMQKWIKSGVLFLLHKVPADELRVLYRHAAVTICPSIAEGFDFSGIESMSSGGITIASDIPVHREIYSIAAKYFSPESNESLVNTLKEVLYSQNSLEIQSELRKNGKTIASLYSPENILPQWEKFLKRVSSKTQ